MLGLALAGCGPEVDLPVATGDLDVSVELVTSPVRRTSNNLLIHVRDTARAPVTGAAVSLEVSMVAHGHDGSGAFVEELDEGEYRAPSLSFSMAGEWRVKVLAEKGGSRGERWIEVTVP